MSVRRIAFVPRGGVGSGVEWGWRVKNTKQIVALDTHCLDYFIEVCESNFVRPPNDMAEQKIALLRTYLYSPNIDCFSITPTAKTEISKIPNIDRRINIESWYVLLNEVIITDENPVTKRVDKLLDMASISNRHAKQGDATVLAECELSAVDTLLTYDKKFNGFLRSQASRTRVLRPLEYWEELNIPRGGPCQIRPAPGHPLQDQDWWIW